MTPERLKQIKDAFAKRQVILLIGDYQEVLQECLDEIERLQAPIEEIEEEARAKEFESWMQAFIAYGFNPAVPPPGGTYAAYVKQFAQSLMKLPDDLEERLKRIGQMLEHRFYASCKDWEKVAHELTTTIRALKVELYEEKDSADSSARRSEQQHQEIRQLQAELTKERERARELRASLAQTLVEEMGYLPASEKCQANVKEKEKK